MATLDPPRQHSQPHALASEWLALERHLEGGHWQSSGQTVPVWASSQPAVRATRQERCGGPLAATKAPQLHLPQARWQCWQAARPYSPTPPPPHFECGLEWQASCWWPCRTVRPHLGHHPLGTQSVFELCMSAAGGRRVRCASARCCRAARPATLDAVAVARFTLLAAE